MSSEFKYRDKTWLRVRYVDDRMSTTQIAEQCGCDASTITRWLHNHGIETRAGGKKVPDERLTDESWMRKQYDKQLKSSREIANACQCSKATVYRWLRKHGIETGGKERCLADPRLADKEWLRQQYIDEGLKSAEIAEKCDCDPSTVIRWLHNHSIEVRPRGGKGERKAADQRLTDPDWLREQYVGDEKTCSEIADQIGCSESAVQTWVNNHDIGIDQGRYERIEKLRDAEWLREQYIEDERTGHDIADECGCSPSVVYDWIRKHGIETQYNGDNSGENHPRYTGGDTAYGPGWHERKRREVRQRDDHTCRDPRCSVTQSEHIKKYDERLHVHHLRKARDIDDPEERNAKENLITLCRDCHRRWEKMADAGLVPEVFADA